MAYAIVSIQGLSATVNMRFEDSTPMQYGGRRGAVLEMSRASRRRLIDQMARLDVSGTRVTFVTLTFSNDVSKKDAQGALRRLWERIRRRYPQVSAVWRLERTTAGRLHFHVMFFSLPYIKQSRFQEVWTECTREELSIVDIRLVRSHRGVMHYVSKYIAKTDETTSVTSLDEPAYLHGGGEPDTGRWWGVYNRERLPWAKKFWIRVEIDDELLYLRWTLRALCHGKCGNSPFSVTSWNEDGIELVQAVLRRLTPYDGPTDMRREFDYAWFDGPKEAHTFGYAG